MTLISRVIGLVRDILFARLLGASAGVSADAFYVAFAIPNFFRRIFGEGAFSQAFVPVLSDYRHQDDQEATQAFVSHMASVFAGLLFLVTLVGVLAAPVLVWILAPGFVDEADKFDLTVQMLRITFPYLMFISLVAMAAGILNAYGKFAAAAFTPVFLNIALIIAAAVVAPRMEQPVLALAWGVFAAGLIQLGFQLPFLHGVRLLPRLRFRMDEGVKRVFRLMGPAIIGSSMAQINMLVNRLLASFLVTGSVSWLYYSDRLMEFPLGVFGIALATVILPSLSRKHAQASPEEFSRLLDWALRWVFVIALPASVGLVVLARPILATLFQYQAFNALDVEMTAQALMAFAAGLPAFILVKVLAPGFFARQDTRTPARIAVIAFGTNIALSLLLVWSLKHVGLALAISLASYVNAGLLFRQLVREQVYDPLGGWPGFLLRVVGASILMGLVLVVFSGETTAWLQADVWTRITRLSLWVSVGVTTYAAGLAILGLRPRHLQQAKIQPLT